MSESGRLVFHWDVKNLPAVQDVSRTLHRILYDPILVLDTVCK